mgnify:FL=1
MTDAPLQPHPFQHQHEMEERLRHIYAQCPRLLEISKLLPTSSAALAKGLKITGNKVQALNAQMQIDALRRERGALLSSLHYTLDDLQPKYSCPDCKDTAILTGTANAIVLSRLASAYYMNSLALETVWNVRISIHLI